MSVMPRKDRYALMKAGYQMAAECELCGSTENLVIDHIIPLAQGGSNDLDNLRTLCSSCNTKEGWRARGHLPSEEMKRQTVYMPQPLATWLKAHAAIAEDDISGIITRLVEQYRDEVEGKNRP